MVGLFSCVYTQVALQRLQVTEACATDLTGIWLLTRVDQHMGAEMSNLKHEQNINQLESNYLTALEPMRTSIGE